MGAWFHVKFLSACLKLVLYSNKRFPLKSTKVNAAAVNGAYTVFLAFCYAKWFLRMSVTMCLPLLFVIQFGI